MPEAFCEFPIISIGCKDCGGVPGYDDGVPLRDLWKINGDIH